MKSRSILGLCISVLAFTACEDSSTSPAPKHPDPVRTDTVIPTIAADIDTAITIRAGSPTRMRFVPQDSAGYQISIFGGFATRFEIRDSAGRDTLPFPRDPYGPPTWRSFGSTPVLIYASGTNPGAAGTVVFSMTKVDGKDDFEPDNTIATAAILKPDSAIQRHIKASHDIDWIKVPVDSAKVYTVAAAGNRAVLVQLFKPDSSELTKPQLSNASYLSDSVGFLYARITLSDSTATAPYTVLAWNDQKQIDAYEPDDVKAQAVEISTDSSVQNHYLRAGETDWMRFHADSGISYKVDVSGIANGTIVVRCVAGSPGCLVVNSSSVVYKAQATGTAYMYFSAYDKALAGAYKIAVSVDSAGIDRYEPDDLPSQAKRIEPNGAPQKHYWQSSERDWVKFHGDSGKCYSIKTTGIEDGTLMIYNDSVIGNSTIQTESSAQITAYRDGDIYVMFCRYRSDVSAPYEIIVSVDSAGIDAYEPDGNAALAKRIPTDGTIQSRYLQGVESDFIKCDVDSGRSYRIKLDGPTSVRYDVYVDSADSAPSYHGYRTSLFKARKTGTALILVAPYLPEDFGAYRISVVLDTFGIDKYEPDDSWTKATSIATGGIPQEHYLQAGESDWLRFEADSGSRYMIKQTGHLQDLQYYVFNGDPNRPDWSASGYDSTEFQAVKSGTHYLRMIAFSPADEGSYQVSVLADTAGVDVYEPDDGMLAAKPIEIGGISQDHYLQFKESDFLKFKALAGTAYSMTISNPDLKATFCLDNGYHTCVPSGTDPHGFVAQTDTTVYVSISGGTSASGAYKIAVAEKP